MSRLMYRSSEQRGASLVELIICTPVLLLLGLGTIQVGLIYHAKITLNYATFEAARKGAVNYAQAEPMRKELGTRLGPVFGGTGTAVSALQAVAQASLDVQDTRYTKLKIISPSLEAFEDWGVLNPQSGVREIPNSHLRQRRKERVSGPSSGVNLQDANLLRIKVTYGYKMAVPLMARWFAGTLLRMDPDQFHYYQALRIPITSTATVRMQSPAREDGNAVSIASDSGQGDETGTNGSSQAPGTTDTCDAYGLPSIQGEGSLDALLEFNSAGSECVASIESITSLLQPAAIDCIPFR